MDANPTTAGHFLLDNPQLGETLKITDIVLSLIKVKKTKRKDAVLYHPQLL